MPKKIFTVKDLKKLLANVPDNLPIARIGYFGEAYFLDKNDFNIKESYFTDSGWQGENRKNLKVLSICVPSIGPEPD
jgi:hypothetical protein